MNDRCGPALTPAHAFWISALSDIGGAPSNSTPRFQTVRSQRLNRTGTVNVSLLPDKSFGIAGKGAGAIGQFAKRWIKRPVTGALYERRLQHTPGAIDCCFQNAAAGYATILSLFWMSPIERLSENPSIQ